jgi:dipeptidyl aminopeptidase/acylaminoacyl peptidase
VSWEERFRAPRTLWVRIARGRPERGIACSNVSGVYQVHRWQVGEPIDDALTSFPTGKTNAWLSSDGEWVCWHEDQAGNEVGHFRAVRWSGGPALDVTPDVPPYASFSAAFGADGTFVASIVGSDRVQLVVVPWAADGPRQPIFLDPGPGFVTAVATASPGSGGSGVVAYSTTAGRGLTTVLRLVDARSGDAIATIDHDPGAVTAGPAAASGRFVATTSRSGANRPLLVEADGTTREFELPEIDGELTPMSISDDGSTVLLLSSHRTVERLAVLDVESGACRFVDRVGGDVASWGAASGTFLDADGTIVVTREDATTLPEVIRVDPADGRTIETLLPAPAVPRSRPFRTLDVPTTNGAMAQGWLVTPDGPGPFPTILDVHGGPQGNELDRFFPVAQAWVDRGFAFFTLNYRGSTGFGREYEQAIWGQPGRCELDDMVAARDMLVRQGIADPARIVPHGGSYGGYLTLLAMGRRPDLWAAGVGLVAIADWRLLYEDGEGLREYQVALFGGTPDERPELHAEASPVTYVADLRAPLLIIQGRNDARCPARQMEDYVERAHRLGKPVVIDWFEAGHGHGAIETRIEWCRRSIEFVEAALGLAEHAPTEAVESIAAG